jgi:hypothetical protein
MPKSNMDGAQEGEYMHSGASSNGNSFVASSKMFRLANVKVTRYESQLKTILL